MSTVRDIVNIATEKSRYQPIPPPVLISQDDIGELSEYVNAEPVMWLRRAPKYPYMRKHHRLNIQFNPEKFRSTRPPFPLEDVLSRNYDITKKYDILWKWVIIYLSREFTDLSLTHGLYYLSLISYDDTGYNQELVNMVYNLLHGDDKNIIRECVKLGLNPGGNKETLNYCITGIYWCKYKRISNLLILREYMASQLLQEEKLYLYSSNLFERYPMRNLLTCYDDNTLAQLFPNYNINDDFRKDRLDRIVSSCLLNRGYFKIDTWNHPYELKFRYTKSPNNSPVTLKTSTVMQWSITLEAINQLITTKRDIMQTLYYPLLRLYLQILASEVSDDYMNMFKSVFENTFRLPINSDINVNTLILILGNYELITLDHESIEYNAYPCLLCMQNRSYEELGLCGHGICKTCQSKLGTTKCPFCMEHFVCPQVDNNFIEVTADNSFKNNQNTQFIQYAKERILQLQAIKDTRKYAFDWVNNSFKVLDAF